MANKSIEFEFVQGETKYSRQIFIQKQNQRTSEEKPFGKTLFIVNIPPYIEKAQLRSAFSVFGDIENNIIEKSFQHERENSIFSSIHLTNESKYFRKTRPVDGFKIAFIVFKMTKSLEKALRANKVKSDIKVTQGIEKWMRNYLDDFLDEKLLQTEVDNYMKAFEDKEQEVREESKKNEVDEDGWTVVKRGKVGGGFQQKESVLKALEDKIVKSKKKKEFKNFYAFQIRDSKQKHIVSLRKKFEEDKLKVSALKKARRFKPF